MVILDSDGAINYLLGEGEYVMQHFPEALDVPVYDDLAHFVRDTLRRK
jgi:hypothetical protein